MLQVHDVLVQRLRDGMEKTTQKDPMLNALWQMWMCLTEEQRNALPEAVRIQVDPESMKRYLEQLPIHTEGVRGGARGAVYFFLTAGEWWPVQIAERPRVWHGQSMVFGSIVYDNGSQDQGPKRWPEWAYATADNTPNLDLDRECLCGAQGATNHHPHAKGCPALGAYVPTQPAGQSLDVIA